MSLRLLLVITTLLLTGLVHVALSIKCMECANKDGLEHVCDSQGSNLTCHEQRANVIFKQMKTTKPSLQEPLRNTGYQCLEMQFAESPTFVKGCIYANMDPCAEFPRLKHCMTCKEDYCNAKWYKDGATAMSGVSFAMVIVLAWVCVAISGWNRF